MRKCFVIIGLCVGLVGCSPNADGTAKTNAPLTQPLQATAPKNNPSAKYLELVGFRIKEKGSGKLEITFGVVNHSEADLGDLTLNVDLRTTTEKAGDAPICSFQAKVPALGPEEMKEVTASVPTKLRVYELPDWQYLRSDFQVAEPK